MSTKPQPNPLLIDGLNVSLADVAAVAREGRAVGLTPEAKDAVTRSRSLVDRLVAEHRAAYGVTTGFGKFSEISISPDETTELQRNLILSHATGVGEPLPTEAVRAMMLLRANALARGHSGIRLETLEALIALLNHAIHPIVPSQGSLGASGDLAPLAHMVLALIGEGEVKYGGQVVAAKQALTRAGLAPCRLAAKEGLALINGTQAMTAIGALAVHDADVLWRTAEIAAALTAEAFRAIPAAYDERLHAVRNHPGQVASARNLRRLLAGSGLVTAPGELRVQDPYTLRCIPQVHGASHQVIEHVASIVEREMNSVTDNPLLFEEADGSPAVISGGNFHGQPVALAMDYLAIGLAELANMSERRVERLVNPQLSGLPAFLTARAGLHSGLMIVQYTAAALVSENKVLCHPASVDSIPSSANQEDHVSMGTIAARKARSVLGNTARVLAIECLTACQALEFRDRGALAPATRAAYESVRETVAPLGDDRSLSAEIESLATRILRGEPVAAVEAVTGRLDSPVQRKGHA